MKKALKTWGLMIAFIVGALAPELHVFAMLLPYLVGVMLTITLVGMEVKQLKPQMKHGVVLLANLCIGLLPWAVLHALGYKELSEAAFFAGITGEAASAPVIVNMLGGKSEFAAVGLVLNSLAAAIIIPAVTPFIITPYGGGEISRQALFFTVLDQVAAMLLAPCIIAAALRYFYPASRAWASKLSTVSLGMWLFCMSIVAATGVTRVSAVHAPWYEVAPFALTMAILCTIGFIVGRKIGGNRLKLECGQCLGQKNATVGIYLSLCYCAPLVFLGPTFYLLCQHVFNTYQLVRRAASMSKRGGNKFPME